MFRLVVQSAGVLLAVHDIGSRVDHSDAFPVGNEV